MKAYLLPKNKIGIECHPRSSGVVRRTIPGVRWINNRGFWVASLSRVTGKAVLALPEVECSVELSGAIESTNRVLPTRPFPPAYRPKTTPYKHQLSGMAHLYGKDRAAVVSEPGTGKTKMAIDAMSAMYLDGLVHAVLIACPVSVRNTWKREFEIHCPVPYEIQMIDSKKDPEQPNFSGLNIVIVGIESLAAGRAFERCAKFMLNPLRSPVGYVAVVDEAHLIKTHNAKRTVNVKMLAINCQYRWFLTGTPIANSLGDLYSLFDFLDPNIIGMPNYWSFMERYAIYGGYENRQVVGWTNTGEITEAVNPYMFKALKKDCLDLPPKVYVTREVAMCQKQERLYKTLKKDKAAGTVTTKGALDLALRLHQIAGGWEANMTPTGEVSGMVPIIGTPPKVAEVLDILEECSDQSVLIWCVYRHEVDALVRAIGDEIGKDKVVEITGGVSEADRWKAVEAIQSKDARVMVGTAASGGVGITLTAASVVIYFSNSFKYVDRVQSEDRCFTGDSPVMTPNGWVAIKDIKVGDMIISGKGNVKQVTDHWSRSVRTNVCEMHSVTWPKKIECSYDHKIMSSGEWKESGKFLPGDVMDHIQPDFDGSDQYIKGHKLDEDMAYVLGYYVGDGFVRKTTPRTGKFVSLAGNKNKKMAALMKCSDWIFRMFGKHPHIKVEDVGVEMRWYGNDMASVFEESCGRVGDEKLIPDEIYKSTIPIRNSFLRGWVDSDGYTRDGCKQIIVGEKRERLAVGAIRLLNSIGSGASVSRGSTNQYVITLGVTKKLNKLVITSNKKDGSYRKLYDITVEDDETFVIGTTVVHNCHRPGQTRSVTIIDLVTPKTVDEHIIQALHAKCDLSDWIIKGHKVE